MDFIVVFYPRITSSSNYEIQPVSLIYAREFNKTTSPYNSEKSTFNDPHEFEKFRMNL